MQHVFYKGVRYLAKPEVFGESTFYSLYNGDGILVHFVNKEETAHSPLLNVWFQTYLKLIDASSRTK